MRKAVNRGLVSAAYKVVQKCVSLGQEAGSHPPVIDRGQYQASWRVSKTGEGVTVSNIAPHAAFIEFGVRPGNVKIGRAMIRALTLWVLRKGFLSFSASVKAAAIQGTKAGYFDLGRKARRGALAANQAESVAWAIAKQFQKTGIFNQGGLVAGKKGLRILEAAASRLTRSGDIAAEVQAEIRAEFGSGSGAAGGKRGGSK